MDFRDQVFLTVAENLNFSKAAEELFISQPAVTKHIKELESKLNITLFERKGNRIYLTKAGKLNYEYLKKIKQQYTELEFELGRLNDAFKGILRIGASSTISQYLIPETLAAFYKRYPKIDLLLLSGNSSEIQQKLLDNEIDIALIEGSSSIQDLRYTDFLDDEIVIVTGNNSVYAKRKHLSIPDLENIPMVLRERGSGTLEVIRKSLQENNINLENLNIVIHLGSTEAIKNFLVNFDGIALISEKCISKELELKQIIKLNVTRLKIDRKFRIALRQGNPSYCAQLFMNFINSYNF
jgi:DNA-binding transcriptional LysR family regulator